MFEIIVILLLLTVVGIPIAIAVVYFRINNDNEGIRL